MGRQRDGWTEERREEQTEGDREGVFHGGQPPSLSEQPSSKVNLLGCIWEFVAMTQLFLGTVLVAMNSWKLLGDVWFFLILWF